MWLDKVTHLKTQTRMTMRPPAPLAAVPVDGPSVSILESEPEAPVEVLRVPGLATTLPSAEGLLQPRPAKIPEPELVAEPVREKAPVPVPQRDIAPAAPPPSKTELSNTEPGRNEAAKPEPAKAEPAKKELAKAPEAKPEAAAAPPPKSLGRAVLVFLLTIAALAAIAWYLGILRF